MPHSLLDVIGAEGISITPEKPKTCVLTSSFSIYSIPIHSIQAWINPQHLPSSETLKCVVCSEPLCFLMQVRLGQIFSFNKHPIPTQFLTPDGLILRLDVRALER